MRVSAQWIPKGSRVLDIGCHQGEFFKFLENKIAPSIGIDPLLQTDVHLDQHHLLPWVFSDVLPFQAHSFDVISLLATIEHMDNQGTLAKESWRLLRPGGRVVITVPGEFVDNILDVMKRFGFVDGMSLDEHHGFKVDELPGFFNNEGFSLLTWKKFQLGLNNLFVFER